MVESLIAKDKEPKKRTVTDLDLKFDLKGPEIAFEKEKFDKLAAESAKLAALTDPHAEASFRINNPLRNFAPFHEAFATRKGDKLYTEPAKRAEIW